MRHAQRNNLIIGAGMTDPKGDRSKRPSEQADPDLFMHVTRRTDAGLYVYCVVLHGSCRLAAAGHEPLRLAQGDFVLIPAAHEFTVSSDEPPPPGRYTEPVVLAGGEIRLGELGGSPDVLILVGHCAFGSPDAALLVSLLPQLVHVRDEARLATLVELVGEETRDARPARDLVLARLLEVLLIEALRSTTPTAASPGLLRGLADPRLAAAIRCMHERPGHSWMVAELAKAAGLSRSTFFERFVERWVPRRWIIC